MSDGPTFAEKIVSQLGTPKEPFGLDDVLVFSILIVGLGAYLAVEQGLAHLLRRLFRSQQSEPERRQEPPIED